MIKIIKRRMVPGLLVLLAGLFVFYRLAVDRSSAMMYVFQARDLVRAQETASGALYLWGPEMTGGGELPGGFYYWIMSLPYLLGMGWEGNWYLLAAIWAAGWMVAFNFLRRATGWQAAWLGLAIFLPPLVYISFLNASMAPAFSLLGMVGIVGTYAGKEEETRARAWLLGCVAMGFGMQLHFSGGTFIVAGIFLFYFARRLRLHALSGSAFRLGLLGFLLPMFPYAAYLAARLLGFELGVPAPKASGSSEGALPSLMYLAEGALSELSLSEFLRRLMTFFPISTLAGLMSILLIPLRPAERRTFYRLRSIWIPLLALSALSAIPASYFILRPIGIRYLAPFSIAIIPLTCILYRFVVMSKNRIVIFVLLNAVMSFFLLDEVEDWRLEAAVFLLLFFGIIFLVSGRKASRKGNAFLLAVLFAGFAAHKQLALKTIQPSDREVPMPRIAQLEIAAEHVIEKTGWSYEQARERLFFINTHMSFSIRHVYEARYEALEKLKARGENAGGISGFLIIFRLNNEDLPASASIKEWILSRNIQADLKQGLADGGILLGQPRFLRRITVVPYQVINQDKYPQKFQNIGYAYEKDPANKIFAGLMGQQGVRLEADGSILFHWSSCAEAWCSSGALVSYRKAGGRLTATVKIMGAPLEQVSEWTGPGWGQLWIQPYFRVQCGGKPVTVPLLSSVGINRQYEQRWAGMILSYSSFLAPVERKFSVPCAGEPREIVVGRQGTTTYSLSGPVDSPATELVYSPRY